MHAPQRTVPHARALSTARLLVAAASVVAVPFVACGADDPSSVAGPGTSRGDAPAAPVIDPGDGGNYDPAIDLAAFVDRVDHPYLPFLPGARWVYEGEADGEVERIEVTVTRDRRTVMGIAAVVVRDTVTIGGELVENTFDWFAQDGDGNVWYLGEESVEYEHGEPVSTEGSWEAGVDGALPGLVMLADPTVGRAYRQEFYRGEAEDLAEVVRLGETVTVPFGTVSDVVVTREWNPLEPETIEEKYYAPGVGLVLERKTAGGDGVVELISYTPGQ